MRATPPVVVSGIADHDTDFLAQLVGKDQGRLGLLDGARKHPQGLGHQAGHRSHVGVTHIPFDLSPWHQCGHRIDHNHIHCAGTYQGFGDLKGLFAGVWSGRSAGYQHPHRRLGHRAGSRACSISIKAAVPPIVWASATICWAMVVFPDDAGPKDFGDPAPWECRPPRWPGPTIKSQWG